jgi:hypothetical protein
MDKVKSKLPTWETTKTNSKKGFDKVYGWVDKLGAPINRFSNRIGSEAFWPTTLDVESYKAARILRSFCSMPIFSSLFLFHYACFASKNRGVDDDVVVV